MKEDRNSMSPAALKALLNNDRGNAMAAMTPGGIERQEALGQKAFNNSDVLPLQFNFCNKEDFEAMGIVFGKLVDDLFQQATLPTGWTKRPTDHSMWSKILDVKGRVRASVFYKAAFYDRKAYISAAVRFSVWPDYDYKDGVAFNIRDCEKVIHRIHKPIPEGLEDYQFRDSVGKEAEAWLNEKYPDWRKPTAYWD